MKKEPLINFPTIFFHSLFTALKINKKNIIFIAIFSIMRKKFAFSLISFFRYNNDNLVNFQNGVAILTKWIMKVSVTFPC